MIIDPSIFAKQFIDAFSPGASEWAQNIRSKRFVYYTSADTALKIIANSELWFRSASVMNDYSEISYGYSFVDLALSKPEGKDFREALDSIALGMSAQLLEEARQWHKIMIFESYIACVSVHCPSEDTMGRLSMWRAYGDVALVLNSEPMAAETDLLKVFSAPVSYITKAEFLQRLEIATQVIRSAATVLQYNRDYLKAYVSHIFKMVSLATKHPGFKEEQELRLFYLPHEGVSPGMVPKRVVLNGAPQIIQALQLADKPDIGLFKADIPNLIERVIVGPTNYPYVAAMAFKEALEEAGVQNAHQKVIASDIPLRK